MEVNRVEGVGVRERSGDEKGEVGIYQVRLVRWGALVQD